MFKKKLDILINRCMPSSKNLHTLKTGDEDLREQY